MATRPDISVAVGVLSQHMASPNEDHWNGIKRILRYLQGSISHGLKFEAGDVLIGYSDADWAGDLNTRRSTSGYIFKIGGATVSWCSKRQITVARSTTEAEYVALSLASQEAVWIRKLLLEIGFAVDGATTLYEDNNGAIDLSRNPKYHNRTKHIDISYHFTRERVTSGELNIIYCPTENMLADIMTKGLGRPKFEQFRKMLGVMAE